MFIERLYERLARISLRKSLVVSQLALGRDRGAAPRPCSLIADYSHLREETHGWTTATGSAPDRPRSSSFSLSSLRVQPPIRKAGLDYSCPRVAIAEVFPRSVVNLRDVPVVSKETVYWNLLVYLSSDAGVMATIADKRLPKLAKMD